MFLILIWIGLKMWCLSGIVEGNSSSGAALANALSPNSLVLTRIWLSELWELERKLRLGL